MARTISLSDEAFATLRREKQVGESDSDVVMRLARTAHRKRKDWRAFFRNPPAPDLSPEEHYDFLHRMDEVDRARALPGDADAPS